MTKENVVDTKAVSALLRNLDGEMTSLRNYVEESKKSDMPKTDPNVAPSNWKRKKSEEEEELRRDQVEADKDEAKRKRKQAEEDEEESKRKRKKSEEVEDDEEKAKLKACADELENDAKRKTAAADDLEESAKRKENEIEKDEIADEAGKMRQDAYADKDEAKRKMDQAEEDDKEAEAKEKMADEEDDEDKCKKMKESASVLRSDATRKRMAAVSLEEDADARIDRAQELEASLFVYDGNVQNNVEVSDSTKEFLSNEAIKYQEFFESSSVKVNELYDAYYAISESLSNGEPLRKFAEILKEWDNFVSSEENDYDAGIVETKKLLGSLDKDILGETYNELSALLTSHIEESESVIGFYDMAKALLEAKEKEDDDEEAKKEIEPKDDDEAEESKAKLKKAIEIVDKVSEHNRILQRKLDNVTAKTQDTITTIRNKYESVIDSLKTDVDESKDRAEKKIVAFMENYVPRLKEILKEEEALSPDYIDSTKTLNEMRKILGITESINVTVQGIDESRVYDLESKNSLLEKNLEDLRDRLSRKSSLVEAHKAQNELIKRIHDDVNFEDIMKKVSDKIQNVSQIDEALSDYRNQSLMDEAVDSSFVSPEEVIKENSNEETVGMPWTTRLQDLAGINGK